MRCELRTDVSLPRPVNEGVKTLVPLVILALSLGCNRYESPTDPGTMRMAAEAVAGDLFVLSPSAIVVQPGQLETVTVSTKEPLPHGSTFAVRPHGIAELFRNEPIAPGGNLTALGVRGQNPGTAILYALVHQPGAAPVEHAIAEIHVRFDERFAVEPQRIVLRPGDSTQVRVRAPWEYPLGVGFECRIPECAVAEISGSIPQGGSEGVITIKALQPGTARIVASIWNFGRAPGQAVVGFVRVEPEQSRRRSVSH